MTAAFPLPEDPISRANWLGRYLGVEKLFDEKLKVVLVDALSGVDDAFGKLGDKFSDKVRRSQLSQSSRALRNVIHGIYGDTGNLIREHRQDAAVAAVDAGLYDQRSILARIFPDSASRTAYADSLRQTGRRNIESVITRVLETERPLSARVYKSEALANGQVATIINRALARGDSASNIARDVKALIDPAVPGGVSYAARRLGRTEINNAFHAQSIHDAQQTPWVEQMEWHLSKVHVDDPGDECETYALLRFFRIESVPGKPHPQCRCYVTPKLPDYNNFEQSLLTGQYDSYLDDVLGFNEQAAQPSSVATLPTPKSDVVEWEGPKVAKPVKDTYSIKSDKDLPTNDVDLANSAVVDDIDQVWTSTDFDEFKTPMRRGARIAQKEGYSGMDLKTKENILELQENTSYVSGPDPSERSDQLLEQYGKEIVAKAVHDTPTTQSYWRGMQLGDTHTEMLVEDQRISMPLSSFSDDEEFATGFATGENDWASFEAESVKDPNPVVIELMPGARAADMTAGERVAFGQFDIVDVVDDPQAGVKRVRIKQVSMIESEPKENAAYAIAKVDEPAKASAKTATQKAPPPFTFKAIPLDADYPLRVKIKAAKTHAEVTAALQEQYPHLTFSQWNADNVTLAGAKEVAIAIDDNMANIPGNGLRHITFQKSENAPTALAVARRMDDGTSHILINPAWSSDGPKLAESLRVSRVNGHNRGWDEERPLYSTFTHEFGHVIDNDGHKLAANGAPAHVVQVYDKVVEAEPNSPKEVRAWEARAKQWLVGNSREPFNGHAPSGYSVMDTPAGPVIDPDEIVAESYADVFINGDNARETSKAVDNLLFHYYLKFNKAAFEKGW